MTKFATLGPDNRVTAFFDSDVNAGQIPAAAIEISDALWASWIVDTAGQVYDAASKSLAPYAPAPVAPTQADLLAYADGKLGAYWTGAIVVNIGTDAAPQNVSVDVSSKGQTFVAGLMIDVGLGSTSEQWFQDGGAITITGTQVQAIGRALKAYVQAAMAVWQAAVDGVRASPQTITTTAEIDALAWPALAQQS